MQCITAKELSAICFFYSAQISTGAEVSDTTKAGHRINRR